MVVGFLKDIIMDIVGTTTIYFEIGEYSYTFDVATQILFLLIVLMAFVICNCFVYLIRGKWFKL